MSEKFVVVHYTQGVIDGGPQATRQFLQVIRYNPYNRVDQFTVTIFTDSPDSAFHFTSKCAAEMAAVTVGGTVEKLEDVL